MKICITSSGNSVESILDERFGRAPYFIIADTDTMKIEFFDNVAAISGGGAGISSGQFVVDKDVQAVITGNVGPNAMDVLKAANVDIYKGIPAAVKENIEQFKKGTLKKISNTVSSHYGLGIKGD